MLTHDCVQGNMPALLSHYRPDAIIYAFTENRAVQRRLALYHGVYALHMPFGETADETFERYPSLSPDMPRLWTCPTVAHRPRLMLHAAYRYCRPWKLSTTYRLTIEEGGLHI